MKKKSALFLIMSFMFLFSGCFGSGRPSSAIDEPSLISDDSLDVAHLVGNRPASLAELVQYSASQQYSSLDSIYNRPPEGMTGNYFVQLSEGNEVVLLSENVTFLVQKENVLAEGFKNGLIRIYGGPGCPSVQTSSEPVNEISWFPGSAVLAATSGNNSFVEVFKVDSCSRVLVADVNSTVDKFAISPKGSWLAIVDKARRLWVGPASGPFNQIYRFMREPLMLSFSDEEGILMAVDVIGELNMWSPLKGVQIFSNKIKGGPFSSVKADGPYLDMITEAGDRFRWDVGQRTRSAYNESENSFYLKNGVVSYRSPRKRLSRKVFFRPVSIEVSRSPSAKAFRVNDIDGEIRYYSSVTGEPLEGIQDLADWKKVSVGRNFSFSERGRSFVLAEPIAQREFQRLYCRFIPSKGYFLWWDKVARPDDYFRSRGMVPRREGISEQSPLKWEPLEVGKIDIRDIH
ncbi:WD40 repeat domain-containing protein [Maridesulfovibrio ferrireducens]|uniref:WD40 repeat domain-containing protein n=1 Tax=Maridesulfovibrio ferrireducens TaxID=246191 RepID=UPI001A1E3E0B|nr:WD40 repeat domain-containing protein [Maridesulfovibrio ferrireducens]MBI9112667.1 WD40 repeat domain-containing protein [Maridesulfovibrio ferrireducens]